MSLPGLKCQSTISSCFIPLYMISLNTDFCLSLHSLCHENAVLWCGLLYLLLIPSFRTISLWIYAFLLSLPMLPSKSGILAISAPTCSHPCSRCHRWYCSALDSCFTVMDVHCVDSYFHKYKALCRVAAWDRCMNNTCTKSLLVQLAQFWTASGLGPNRWWSEHLDCM